MLTFLLTDVEGSARLWEQDPAAMRSLLAWHDARAASVAGAHGGTLVKSRGEGDSLFLVFERPGDAVVAALDLQRALIAGSGSPAPTLPLHVRMALHVGEAELRDADYYGPAVNRCARLRGLAHGGQILLSQAAAGLAGEDLPPGASFKDLGRVRLRDLAEDEQVFQLLHASLPADFPPLAFPATLPHNLPNLLTSFVGREADLERLAAMLAPRAQGAEVTGDLCPLPPAQLVTLTGAGGCGKTRLALEVAARLLGPPGSGRCDLEGVWLAELAALSDPAQVLPSVAAVLNVREEPGRPLVDTLADTLRPRKILLVLDNCEHLVGPCAAMVDALLRASPELRVLATSREALAIPGETTYRVDPLAMPHATTTADVAASEAGELFLQRARSANPAFALTESNAAAVAGICRRLDGIPLALELAAARVRVLSPEQIEMRLAGAAPARFRLLTGGSRTALERHQTLTAAIEWSYELLSEPERQLMRTLSVFAGGWTLEAAEAVCGSDGVMEPWSSGVVDTPDGPGSNTPILQHSNTPQRHSADVLDLLTALVDKSLVVVEGGGPDSASRYRFLETIREFAGERLEEAGEGAVVRDHHLGYFLSLAEQGEAGLKGAEQEAWLARLETEHPNLLVAIEGTGAGADPAGRGLRLASLIWKFWEMRGHFGVGCAALQAALEREGSRACPAVRAGALNGAGVLAWRRGDNDAARTYYDAALAAWRSLDNRHGIASTLNNLGLLTWNQGDYAQARALYEESLALRRDLGDRHGAAAALNNLGILAHDQRDSERARALHEESLAIRRDLGDLHGIATSLNNLGEVAREQGDTAGPRVLYEEALAIRRGLGDRHGMASALHNLGDIALAQGEHEAARLAFAEVLETWRDLGDRSPGAGSLESTAALAGRWGAGAQAARLLGSADRLRASLRTRRAPADQLDYERHVAAIRASLGEPDFQARWSEGSRLDWDQAVEEALAWLKSADPAR